MLERGDNVRRGHEVITVCLLLSKEAGGRKPRLGGAG